MISKAELHIFSSRFLLRVGDCFLLAIGLGILLGYGPHFAVILGEFGGGPSSDTIKQVTVSKCVYQ